MRDITEKITTSRTAIASATLKIGPQTIELIRTNRIPKGDPLSVAKVAAIQAAKNTSQIIPYCHPLPIDFVDCRFELRDDSIEITTEVKAVYKTGVEMEALTAASVAALTIYDMVKQVDEEMEIVGVRIVSKRGGKSDFQAGLDRTLTAAVLVLSDSVAAGSKEDASGKALVSRLEEKGIEIIDFKVIPDDEAEIVRTLTHYCDTEKVDLVMTAGGTGLGARDVTPEAMAKVIERDIPGIPEAARAFGQDRTPLAMLSRARAGVRGQTIIINLPGSPKGVEESLDAILPGLFHAFRMLWGGGHS